MTIHSVFGPDGNWIAEYNEATGALLREYVWLDGEPVAVREGGVNYFVRVDHIGRPVFATNSAGAKVWSLAYLPFGGVRAATGVPTALRFPGQWFQSENGLHQNWMRDYDPTTGRYLQADPLGLVDGASVYGYVKQNPGRWVDPRGLLSTDPWVPLPTTPGVSIPFGPGTAGILVGRVIGGALVGILWPSTLGDGTFPEAHWQASNAEAEANTGGSNTVPWPERNRRNWTCICRAFRDGRSERNCPTLPPYAFGWGTNKDLKIADETARADARARLGAVSTHHTQCKCTGPNGERVSSGGRIR